MTKGRKSLPPASAPAVAVDAAAVASDAQALTALNEAALQVQQLYGLESLDRATLEAEIGVWIQHTGRAMFMIGARLHALRVMCPNGEWMELLDRLGMRQQTAHRLITAARKCVGADGRLRQTLMALPQSKVLELALDDEQLDELDRTGTVEQLALTLDEIDCCSASQLRQRLREAQRDKAAKDAVIRKRDERLARLEQQLARPFEPSAESAARNAAEDKLLTALRDHTLAAEAALREVCTLMDAATSLQGADQALAASVNGAVAYLAQRLADLIGRHGVEVDLQDLVVPEFIAQSRRARKPS